MKTIGILGGISAASTQTYYSELCRLASERLGGLHSPELLIRSLDFARIESLQMAGEWERAGGIYNELCRNIVREPSRVAHMGIANRLIDKGADFADPGVYGGRHAAQRRQRGRARA